MKQLLLSAVCAFVLGGVCVAGPFHYHGYPCHPHYPSYYPYSSCQPCPVVIYGGSCCQPAIPAYSCPYSQPGGYVCPFDRAQPQGQPGPLQTPGFQGGPALAPNDAPFAPPGGFVPPNAPVGPSQTFPSAGGSVPFNAPVDPNQSF